MRRFVLTGVLAGVLLGTLPPSARAQDRWFAPDKAAHFVTSFFLTTAVYTLARDRMEKEHAIQTAVGVTAGLGIAKEVHDALSSEGTFSGKDLVWDALGIGLGVVIIRQDDRRRDAQPAALLSRGRGSLGLQRALIPHPVVIPAFEFPKAANAVDSGPPVSTIRPCIDDPPGG
ncbi:MAG: VanZ family protein [bacterium]